MLLQSCRGTFGSGGEFEPMRHEIADGQDTVAWLREQSWFDGRLATYGASYLGFVQWALAMDPPPELAAVIVHVGPHDFSRTAYRNGVFDLYNYVGWSDLVAHQENTRALQGLLRMGTAERRLRPVLDRLPVTAGVPDLLGREPLWSERWLEHPQLTDPFWAPLQCGAALQRITVPVLVVGGWQDLFIEQNLEQYRTLAARGVPTRLLVGPVVPPGHHGQGRRRGRGEPGLARPLRRPGKTRGNGSEARGNGPAPAAHPDHPVRIWVGGQGAGEWRELSGWPPTGTTQQRWHLGAHGSLSTREPSADVPAVSFRYDPADPTPSPGGAILAVAGGSRDNRAVERRLDVLVFSSDPLEEPVEVLGEVAAEFSVARDNPYADLFARLCDVDPRGRSWNVCDGIVRLAGRTRWPARCG